MSRTISIALILIDMLNSYDRCDSEPLQEPVRRLPELPR